MTKDLALLNKEMEQQKEQGLEQEHDNEKKT